MKDKKITDYIIRQSVKAELHRLTQRDLDAIGGINGYCTDLLGDKSREGELIDRLVCRVKCGGIDEK